MSDKSGVAGLDSNAIYHEVSPNIILLLRFFNCLALIMVIISVVLCIVQGQDHNTYYLLVANTVISFFVGCVINWWYRTGDLGPEKFWYIFIVGTVIIFQCITTDAFVFHVLPEENNPVFTTHRPNFTMPTRPSNASTFPAMSIKPASTVPTILNILNNRT